MPPPHERSGPGIAHPEGRSSAQVSGAPTSTKVDGSTADPRWPAGLSDADLAKLVRQVDAAVRAMVELPVADHDLVAASAVARVELRRRRARQKVAEARAALTEAGWSP